MSVAEVSFSAGVGMAQIKRIREIMTKIIIVDYFIVANFNDL